MEQIDALAKKYETFGDIIVIDSDDFDNEMFAQIGSDLGFGDNLHIFEDGESAMEYLRETPNRIGIIFCEIYLPKRNGMELKVLMREDSVLRKKSVPFILFSTVVNPADVELAYLELPVQGLFLKQSSYAEMKAMVDVAIQYWSTCIHPQ
ncbi:MAG: response regulator [Flavobacterium sp.]|nr:MAG: response regulator [Flavobacterium sp.]